MPPPSLFTTLHLACAGLGFLPITTGHAADIPVVRWEGRTMGSPYATQIVGADLPPVRVDALRGAIEQRLLEVNRQMSHYDPESELSRFNRAPASTPFKVSPEFARVVRFSLEMNRLTEGAFDPTLGPAINLWGFGEKTDQRAVPPEAELAAAMRNTGCAHLKVTDRDELIKDIPGLSLNLSAVAKGFAVDEMVRILRDNGVTSAYASIAGEVRVLGHNSRGTPWQVGIAAPIAHWNETDPMATVVSVSDRAVSTSGDYQKFFTDAQGARLCHILDPKTGRPVQNEVAGISVIAPDSMTADALGTSLFVMGETAGKRFIDSRPGCAALFIVRTTDGAFRLAPSSRFEQLTAPPRAAGE